MSAFVPLLKRDWIEFKKYVFSIFLFWILMPILIHIFLAIPLSRLIIVDIRSNKEWETTGTIMQSKKITAFDEEGNFKSTFLDSFQNIANFTTKVVFVSKNGDVSSILANGFAEHLNYKNMYSLRGGIQEWISQNKPITK